MCNRDYLDIPLFGRGKVTGYAIIEPEDWELVRDFRWFKDHGYASACVPGSKRVRMARLIVGLKPGGTLCVDHINRDRLDNRRSNLRVVTKGQNGQNVSARWNASSRHRGVSFREGKWTARCTVNGKVHFLGDFTDEDEAGRVAREFRMAHLPFAEA